MLDGLLRVFSGRTGWELARDVLDIALVTYLIYRALLVIRGTRAMQMGIGLGMILLLYLASKAVGLVTVQTLLQYVLSSIILIVIVVFQNDIRRALIRVGGQVGLGRRGRKEQSRVIDEVVAAVTELARHRIGAIITFEQDANLLEFTKSEGIVIGAAVTRELLVAMFYPESVNKLHDGAVIIRDLKIARAGVFFPMPDTKIQDHSFGSRHRAALGITEETDAVVVVVSEERGTISFCFNGNIVPNIDGTALRQTLVRLLEQKQTEEPARAAPTSERPGAGDASANIGADAAPPSQHPSSSPSIPPAPATSTPLPSVVRSSIVAPAPRAVDIARIERARAEAVRSAEPEIPHSKAVTQLMPRTGRGTIRSRTNDPRPSTESPASEASTTRTPEDTGPVSDRASFVPSAHSGEESERRAEEP
jgi:diadenylate cyclase